ncbi:aspartyl-phosphate phosphatase Spo0E family protein [Neobacillus mesonae]|uniref:aspartyl-phosphate phosphatase Spo0E family protein n=1 Tax=Neobacillus mesonae TaxID=1193713 RepID=UPI002040D9D0|nr:aspartyl-phosphate phosphatase Spo0E family protein [Neobacillus mesonae]MCM3569828.1 aspartyl-phosphate phosphatase Spo0E family protein [Neobacillus mesonae]
MDKERPVLGPFELRLYIEYLRAELINIGQKNGLCHQLTIQASEQLDFFLNEYKKVSDKRD